MNELLKAWTAPTVVITLITIVFGGIIWGVQLNIGFIQNREDITVLQEISRRQTDQLNEMVLINAKQSLLLEHLIEEVNELENPRISP